jgi:hypothetical protein
MNDARLSNEATHVAGIQMPASASTEMSRRVWSVRYQANFLVNCLASASAVASAI